MVNYSEQEDIYISSFAAGIWHRPLSDLISYNTIQGNLTYDNKYGTPIKEAILYLKDPGNNIVDSTTTDSTGHYIFNNVISENYSIVPVITLAWGGVNPTDAINCGQNFYWDI